MANVASWKHTDITDVRPNLHLDLDPETLKNNGSAWLFNRDSYKWLLKNPHFNWVFFDFIPNIPKTTTLAILRVMCPFWGPQIKGLFCNLQLQRLGKTMEKRLGNHHLAMRIFCIYRIWLVVLLPLLR